MTHAFDLISTSAQAAARAFSPSCTTTGWAGKGRAGARERTCGPWRSPQTTCGGLGPPRLSHRPPTAPCARQRCFACLRCSGLPAATLGHLRAHASILGSNQPANTNPSFTHPCPGLQYTWHAKQQAPPRGVEELAGSGAQSSIWEVCQPTAWHCTWRHERRGADL